MGDRISAGEGADISAIDFKESFASSELFKSLFNEGMDLVKDVAAYLDGSGRIEAQGLGRDGNLLYTQESMRLTTRLMQMASWLLVHRAVGEGEISTDESRSDKNRVLIEMPDENPHMSAEELPRGLRDLMGRCQAMQERIARMDAAIREKSQPQPSPQTGLSAQLEQLTAAFSLPPQGKDED